MILNTIVFRPQTLEKVRTKYQLNSTMKRFHLNCHTIGFHPQSQKLELHTKYIVPCESTAEEVLIEWSNHRISSTDSKGRVTY